MQRALRRKTRVAGVGEENRKGETGLLFTKSVHLYCFVILICSDLESDLIPTQVKRKTH